MRNPEQSPIARQARIEGINRRLLEEQSLLLIRSGVSASGMILYAVSLSEKFGHLFPPVVQIGSGIVFVGGLAASLDKGVRMFKIWRETMDAYGSTPPNGNIAEIMKPLTIPLSDDEKRRLTASEASLSRLLPSGLPDSRHVELETLHRNKTPAVARPRIEALIFALKELLDIHVISASPTSYRDRNALLQQLKRILAAPPNAFGLSLTGPEEDFLTRVINIGVMTERAPETMVTYVRLLGELIESYVLGSKIEPRGNAIADDLATAAVRAGYFAGRAVPVPITEWKKVKNLEEQEAKKVVLTDDQVIAFAKSVVALGNNRAPDVRKAFVEILPGLKELLGKEKDRLKRVNKNSQAAAVMNTVLFILELSSIDKVVDKETIESLNQLFGHRLSGKSRIAPRDLMDEFKKTGFGSWSIDGDTIVIMARNTCLADALACAAIICYPYIPRIEICVNEDYHSHVDSNEVTQSAMIPTGVFYSQRLITYNRQFVTDLLRDRSSTTSVNTVKKIPPNSRC